MFDRPEKSSQLLRTIKRGLSPSLIFFQHPWSQIIHEKINFLPVAFLLVQLMSESSAAFVMGEHMQGILCCHVLIWVFFMKVVCHRKGWGGNGAGVSSLVLIICKSMSGTDLDQDLLSGWAEHLCSHMTTMHRAKTLHSAEPQIPSHEMKIENLPLLLA